MSDARHRTRSSLIAGVSAVVTALVVAIACLALLAVMGIGNFQATQQRTSEPAPVLGTVETGAVETSSPVKVHSLPSSSLEITASQFGSGTVTAGSAAEGAVLNDGDILLTVNELPIVVLQGAIPAYRSIGPGMQGGDVAQVQAFLKRAGYSVRDRDGTFGASTAEALARLYKARGFPVVTADGTPTAMLSDAGLPQSRYVFVASVPVVVGDGCGRTGQPTDAVKCVLRSAAVTVAISDTSGRSLTGRVLYLSATSGERLAATVGDPVARAVTDSSDVPRATEGDRERWYSLVGMPAEGPPALSENARVILDSSPSEGLRVPATAIREATDGSTFVREAASGERTAAPDADHSVEVVLCGGGACAVRGGDLTAGMKVVLFG